MIGGLRPCRSRAPSLPTAEESARLQCGDAGPPAGDRPRGADTSSGWIDRGTQDGSLISLDFGWPTPAGVTYWRGEAHFQVAKNANRPFVVQAGAVEFRAVGTAFDVQLGATQVQMIVTEGRVAGGPRRLCPRAGADAAGSSPTPIPSRSSMREIRSLWTWRRLNGKFPKPSSESADGLSESEQELAAWQCPPLDLERDARLCARQWWRSISTVRVRLELGDRDLGKVGISGTSFAPTTSMNSF